MPKFRELQAKLTPESRALLDFVWDHFLAKKTWPTNREVYVARGKEKVQGILHTLDSTIIREVDGSNSQKNFELPLLGILSTSKSAAYLALLRRYLDYLRDFYYTRPDTASVKHTDVQAALELNAADTALLGRLVFAGFLNSSGGYQPDFSDWGVSLPAALEDMPSTGDLQPAFEGLLDQLAAMPRPVLLKERVAEDVRALNIPPLAIPGEPPKPGSAPVVFISYSHDTREHKMWVLEVAQQLYKAGIDIILDQWELRAGDDTAKFMERSVKRAERVLMICTETYVRKVNEGKGGAGYEGMIVTSEIINDQGGAKFIPIIRQDGAHAVPTCVSTRAWINLSAGAQFEEEMKRLITDLRKDPPPTKPTRSPTALATEPMAAPEPPSPPPPHAAVAPKKFSDDPTQAYREALQLARASDLVTWRKLIAVEKQRATEGLLTWRQQTKGTPQNLEKELPAYVKGMTATHHGLFAIAAAGVESGQPKFNHQAALVYDLIKPPGWERDGYTFFVQLPEANVFVFQALIGAMAVYSNQSALAIDLATQRIVSRENSSHSQPLFLDHGLTAWPHALGRDAKRGWQFLMELPDHFPWIMEAFGSAAAFREHLSAYYLLLSWLEFITYVHKNPGYNDTEKLRLDIPPLFVRSGHAAIASRLLLQDRVPLVDFARKLNVPIDRWLAAWPHWVGEINAWLLQVYPMDYWPDSVIAELQHFAEDVHRS